MMLYVGLLQLLGLDGVRLLLMVGLETQVVVVLMMVLLHVLVLIGGRLLLPVLVDRGLQLVVMLLVVFLPSLFLWLLLRVRCRSH
jgi:hypothetical protein